MEVQNFKNKKIEDKMLHLHGGYSHHVNGSVNEHLYIGIIHMISIFLVLAKLSNCMWQQVVG